MPDKPARIQLSRAKGWRLPPNTVKVDRTTRWGNPWTIAAAREAGYTGNDAAVAEMCVAFYRNGIAQGLELPGYDVADIQAALRGKNLACWCKPGMPCHADVLLAIANRPICEEVGA